MRSTLQPQRVHFCQQDSVPRTRRSLSRSQCQTGYPRTLLQLLHSFFIRTFTVFSHVQQDSRIRFPTLGKRLHSGSLAQSAASRSCGPCTASNGICHTRRFSDPCGICPAAGRRHRKHPCRRAQADCGRAIHVAHVAVQQKLGASVSLTAQRPSTVLDKPRSGLAVGWSALLCRGRFDTFRWASELLLPTRLALAPQLLSDGLDVVVETSSKLLAPAPGFFDNWVFPHRPMPR